jgi:uncharacterized protein (DUF697 family)
MVSPKSETVKKTTKKKVPLKKAVESSSLRQTIPVIAEKKEEIPVQNQAREETVETQVQHQAPEETQKTTAHKWVTRYMLWSMGAGLIPIPLVDLFALAGVQLKMLHRLSQHYDVPFEKNRGKSIIAALAGTITADSLRRGPFTSIIKSIPLVGIIGSLSMPIYSGAITYAIGKLFIHHFESGGTFLDFDFHKFKEHFAELYKQGQKAATNFKSEYKKA